MGLSKTPMNSSKYSGKIRSMYTDYEDKNVVRLEIDPAGQPKPKKGEVAPMSTRSENVSATMARKLAIGDQVQVVTIIRKVEKGS